MKRQRRRFEAQRCEEVLHGCHPVYRMEPELHRKSGGAATHRSPVRRPWNAYAAAGAPRLRCKLLGVAPGVAADGEQLVGSDGAPRSSGVKFNVGKQLILPSRFDWVDN